MDFKSKIVDLEDFICSFALHWRLMHNSLQKFVFNQSNFEKSTLKKDYKISYLQLSAIGSQ